MNAQTLPTEIVLNIFGNLNKIQDVISCSDVCVHWKLVVDSLSDNFWKKICAKEFKDCYEECYRKANLTWRELAMSLALWSDVKNAKVKIHKVQVDRITKVSFLRNGVAVFTDGNTVVYYDLVKKQEISRNTLGVTGMDKYVENDDLIVFEHKQVRNGNVDLMVRVTSKFDTTKFEEFDGFLGTPWILRGNELFHQIFDPDFEDTNFWKYEVKVEGNEVIFKNSKLSDNIEGDLEDVKYIDGKLYVFKTFEGCMGIVSVENNKVDMVCNIDDMDETEEDILSAIKSHGFCWSHPDIYYWVASRLDYDFIPLVYGNYVIIGTKSPFEIRIFDKPYDSNGRLDLDKVPPVKVIDLEQLANADGAFVNRSDDIGDEIQVVETMNGHVLVVLMCDKLLVIDIEHVTDGNDEGR